MFQSFIPAFSLSWVLTTTLAALSLYWLWTKTRRPYLKYNIPPFAVPPTPIVGHFFKLGFNFRETLQEWKNKAGDFFSMDIAGQLHIVVSGYDNIKEVLVKNADSLPNGPKVFVTDLLGEDNKGIIGARDENWKEQRTVSLSILRDFGMGKNVLAEKIQEEVSVYIDQLAALKGRPDDIRLLTNISTSNVICSIIIGKRFEHDDPYFIAFMDCLNNVLKYANRVPLVSAFPLLRHLPGDFFYIKKWCKCVKDTNDMFAKAYIKEIKKSYNKEDEPGNFITAYLQEMDKKKAQGKDTLMDEANLVAIIRILFLAGTETTSTTIVWCVLYMLHHPDVQEKVVREIEEHVGTDRLPSVADRQKLVYLNAVIMETQRMASIVPVGIRREVSRSFEVGGYTLPKGSIVWPCLDSVMQDKKLWGDPEKFRPERFLDKNKSLLNPEELIPFSVGRKVCLGQGLAKMELFLFLANMFQRFKFLPADDSGKLPSIEGVTGGTVVPHPFQVRFIERNA